ncbi:MAG: V-type ATP synthase subunit A [Clostridia bacterium]|nr:V-type ATP synthase subunit A [Clostridia bacterium]
MLGLCGDDPLVIYVREQDSGLVPQIKVLSDRITVKTADDIKAGGIRGESAEARLIFDDTLDSAADSQRGYWREISGLSSRLQAPSSEFNEIRPDGSPITENSESGTKNSESYSQHLKPGTQILYRIFGINGPVVTVSGRTGLEMSESCLVGSEQLIGEVIKITEDAAVIQVYEDTGGLRRGDAVVSTGAAMSVTLAPGLLGNIYDGIGRPLSVLAAQSGAYLPKGQNAGSADEEKLWEVKVRVNEGDTVSGGQIFAECPETAAITHRAMIPPSVSGKVVMSRGDGSYRVNDTIIRIESEDGQVRDISLAQKWPVRIPRPVRKRLPVSVPLITGQRIIDTMFPIAKGGSAAIPGGFGTGKTVLQHQLAKFADADIIVYVGCGERGNEMTQALTEFSELTDPNTGRPLLERTILIANTSNMPVAAREASIYTGITLAEYYRDMGYNTAIMADSTSRWAEALREISGRLEEMPAEEGYPAYLPSRLAAFYERAGYFEALSGSAGSVTIIGAVSPAGADFSEPVTQNTKRFTRCFWALDKSLAYARHYPAVNWNESYSEYAGELEGWFTKSAGDDFAGMRSRIIAILSEENRLNEVVKLLGADLLPEEQKLTLEIAAVIRIGFLQQNALDPADASVPVAKQREMMRAIIHLADAASDALKNKMPVSEIIKTGIFDMAKRMKFGGFSLDDLNTEIDKVMFTKS